MNTPTSGLPVEATAAFTHIFLSLDLLEEGLLSEETRSLLSVIRKNTERLQSLIQPMHIRLT